MVGSLNAGQVSTTWLQYSVGYRVELGPQQSGKHAENKGMGDIAKARCHGNGVGNTLKLYHVGTSFTALLLSMLLFAGGKILVMV